MTFSADDVHLKMSVVSHISFSLDTESAATLVHSFVMSRIDYSNAVLTGVPKVMTNKLQWVLSAAVRVVSGTHKFD